jgi:transcription termination factor Rho
MSVSQQLERSALEGKDRDELHTIAVALGGKPTSRAKKADIIDLILRLAGVITEDAPPAAPTPPVADPAEAAPDAVSPEAAAPEVEDELAAPRRRRRRAAAAAEADAPAEATSPGEGGPGAEGSGAEGAATEEAATDQASLPLGQAEADADRSTEADTAAASDVGEGGGDGRAAEPAAPARSGGQGRERPGADRSNQGRAAQDRSNQDRGNQDRANQDRSNQERGDQNRADQDADRAEGDSDEAGNRRRRRRGRDRDGRGGDDQYVGEPVEVAGLLDLRDEGYGFLRLRGYLPSKDDVYVSVKQVRQFGLRKGDHVKGASRPASRNEKNPALLRIDAVNGGDAERSRNRPRFEDLTPLFPDERLRLETPTEPHNMTARITDLVSPIGKGQRGLIVSPPKAGKTTVMKQIARSIEANNPDVALIVLLIDERPEEVTDMRRSVQGEVAASTFDRPADEHTAVAELVIERAKRMVEDGQDVVIILDGITRLARAYNLAAPATGRIMSGGIDTGALYPPKKFFGAARNIEEGGSLTILATALIDTGSKMDEVIFEEFKGTGNMELRLDRRLAERRIYPAIDVDASSTRHEELLFERKQLQQVWKLRRVLSGLSDGGGGAGLEMLIERLGSFRTNEEFLSEVGKAPSVGA